MDETADILQSASGSAGSKEFELFRIKNDWNKAES